MYGQTNQNEVVALSNAAPPVTDITFHLLDPRIPLSAPMRSVSVDAKSLARYVGRYDGGSGMVFVITLGRVPPPQTISIDLAGTRYTGKRVAD